MRDVIKNLDEITDSREILEAKPHPFTTIFIYILIAMLLSAFVWSWFSQKEILIKANGVIEPEEDTYKVASLVSGKVETINFINGQQVGEGEVLLTVNHDELDLQKESYQKSIETLEIELANLNKLIDSINDGKNYFDKNLETEKEYYDKYLNYTLSKEQSEDQLKQYEKQKADYEDKIVDLELLLKSINENRNYFKEESIYYNQYLDYTYNVDKYNALIEQAQDNYDTTKKTFDEQQDQLEEQEKEDTNSEEDGTQTITPLISTTQTISEQDVETAQKSIDSAKADLANYKNGFILNIKNSIVEAESALTSVSGNISALNNTNNLSEDKTKISYIVQINDQIKSLEENLKQYNDNLESTNQKIDSCIIKSEKTGVINIINEVKEGDVLQAGTQLATVLPEESNNKVMLYISNKDIANVHIGQEIKYNFLALPYKEYGYVKGEIVKISPDATMDQESGASYYIAEGLVGNDVLKSHKGEVSELKTGMLCNAEIITRDEKMLYYLLEKINLKD